MPGSRDAGSRDDHAAPTFTHFTLAAEGRGVRPFAPCQVRGRRDAGTGNVASSPPEPTEIARAVPAGLVPVIASSVDERSGHAYHVLGKRSIASASDRPSSATALRAASISGTSVASMTVPARYAR